MKLKQAATRALFGLLAILTLSTSALAAGDTDSTGSNDNNTGNSLLEDSDNRVSSEDGGWEISLYYKGGFHGSALLVGDGTKQTAMAGAYQNAVQAMIAMDGTPWGDSRGVKLEVNTAPVNNNILYVEGLSGWTNVLALRAWGEDSATMQKFMLDPIYNKDHYPEHSQIVKMITELRGSNRPSDEEIQAKLDSGEYFPFFVSFRPVLLYHRTGYLCDGSGVAAAGGVYFDYNNREEHKNMWKNSIHTDFYFG